MGNRSLGAYGEQRAARYLHGEGYQILTRNWQVREGEIDIIAELDGEVVFVEVKTRRGDLFGSPEESITHKKRKRIIKASLSFLQETKNEDANWRVDLVAIYCTPEMEVIKIEHYENVIKGPLEEFL